MEVHGRNTERTNQRNREFVKGLVREILFLAAILIGIVVSSLPIALLYQSGDSAGSEPQKVSRSSDADAPSVLSTRQHDQRLTLVNDTNRPQHQKRKTSN